MAIIFIQKRKKQVYLLIALVILVLAIIVVWWSFFKGKKPIALPSVIPELVVSGYPEIKINFEVLERPEMKEFIPFEEISPFEEEVVGRENPFLPY